MALKLKDYQITETEIRGFPVRTIEINSSTKYFSEDIARAYGFVSREALLHSKLFLRLIENNPGKQIFGDIDSNAMFQTIEFEIDD